MPASWLGKLDILPSFSLREQFAQRRGSVGKLGIPAPHSFVGCTSHFLEKGSLLILLVRAGEGEHHAAI